MRAEAVASKYSIFNRRDVVAVGWYWLLPSRELKRGAVKAVSVLGYELALFRGDDGTVAALDAYCPHMGAHLGEGKVEGNELRCFFHNWCFDAEGSCTDIPCLEDKVPKAIRTQAWIVRERYGLIWIWIGRNTEASKPLPQVPLPPELLEEEYDVSLGKMFVKNCHPNVVMINAIDEQHFRTVHKLPGEVLSMAPNTISAHQLEFCNQGTVAKTSLIGKLIAPFYKDRLTYNLVYSFGSTGIVTFGPDFLHLNLMFALRMSNAGKTEGYLICFAKKNNGILSLFNWFILWLTQVGAFYFAIGDTKVFRSIRFRFATPIPADRAVLAFIQHLEKQEPFPAKLNEHL